MSATGGAPPYTWSMRDGSLPGGLALSADGIIAGTPALAGTFTFTMAVHDLNTMVTDSCTITIVARLTASAATSGTAVVELGHAAATFATQTGGHPPFTYALTSGSLPPGTSLNGLSLSGSFRATGVYRFTAQVTDSLGATASVTAAYQVFSPITFPARGSSGWTATCSGTIGTGCTAQVAYSGGTPGTRPTLTWRTTDTALNPVPVPTGASGQHDLLAPTVSGGAVHIQFLSDRTGTGGGLPWTGVVVVTLTDPATGETTTAYILIQITS